MPPHEAPPRLRQGVAVSTVDSALAAAARAGLARLDSQLLLLHAWDKAPQSAGTLRAWLLAHGEDAVPPDVGKRFGTLVQRRSAGEPLAYITGHKEFFGLALAVDARVLIPRPDTELLVSWALEVLADRPASAHGRPPTVLDLGTGSGAVALAIKHGLPQAHVDAVDASAEALALAESNARNLGLQVRFVAGDWLQPVHETYDCIVSNPPYVAEADPHLPALRHEPLQALVAGPDGLQDIRTITAAAVSHLHPGGRLLVEHGFDQGPAVRRLFAQAGFVEISTRRDLAGHERCTGGRVIHDGLPLLVK